MTSTKRKAVAVALTCTVVGAAGGIVGSMAAPAKHRSTSASRDTTVAPGPGRGDHDGMRGPGRPPVHAEAVVLDNAGKAWITETDDNGTVKGVDGSAVTIAEGTTAVPYKDVTVTLPGDATIVRNGAKAAAGDLKAGDRIHVSSSTDGTFVFAADDSWRPRRGWGHGPGGPGGPPGGPPGPPR